jgi:hypothetical protein
MIWASKSKEITRIMNMKLKHNCAFVKMYTNNLIKVLNPYLIVVFHFFSKFKTSSYFCQMVLKTLSPNKFSMEEHFST